MLRRYIADAEKAEGEIRGCEMDLCTLQQQLGLVSQTATVFGMAEQAILTQPPKSCRGIWDLLNGGCARDVMFCSPEFAIMSKQDPSTSEIALSGQKLQNLNAGLSAKATEISGYLRGCLTRTASLKAIEETRQVSKLTELAFFFIPLAFTTSIFGMDVKVGLHHTLCAVWVG
jgi:hypothetical protein